MPRKSCWFDIAILLDYYWVAAAAQPPTNFTGWQGALGVAIQ
jgi:hypothetical protein